MQLTMLKGYPDLIGRRQAFVGTAVGPASYNATAGDVVAAPGYERYIDSILDVSQDPTGTYNGQARPSVAGGRATWTVHYYLVSSGAEVGNGVNLSAFNFTVAGFMGEY